MFIETTWGKRLAWVFGGYESCLALHRIVGVFMICLLLIHLFYLAYKIDWRHLPRSLFGPDSLLPQPSDIISFFRHVAWFFGLGEAPKFGRWGYWEKFDYWAVFWGIPVLGLTGLALSYPMLASRLMPGWGLNLAFWIHRIEAILAMAHVFVIHFFIGHLRRHNFPMDRAMFEGSVDFDSAREERALWIERLEGAGKLQSLVIPEARRGLRALYYLFGYAVMAAGVFLLIGGLVNSTSITW